MVRELAKIYNIKRLAPEIYSMWCTSPIIAKQTKPGQFVQVQIKDSFEPFLCRPISIADAQDNKLRMIFRVRGKGTKLLIEKKVKECIYLLGPLGDPIPSIKGKNIILCAGGVGIAPLLFLAKKLAKNNKLYLFFGAKNKSELILLNEFKQLCEEIFLTTDDGSQGKKGFVTDLLFNNIRHRPFDFQYLFTAGPVEMIKKISNFKFPISNLKLYGFLEERMGCGCGICFTCGVKKKDGGYFRTCTDGPVFDLSLIEL
jgi:dihydroorotate dehydrogenase electron transfer subunit